MTWLIWRQHRKAALVMLALLAALAAFIIPTGLRMRHAVTGFADCVAKLGGAQLAPETALGNCHDLSGVFLSKYSSMQYVAILLLFAPVLIGMFWGAPLVAREVEQGTHRFVWTQGVSRRRWMLTKIGIVGGFVLLVVVVYTLLMSWWMRPFTIGTGNRLRAGFFDSQGVVPIAYTIFAVALGFFAGTYWRKVLPAMAVTLVGFAAARIGILALARQHFAPPKSLSTPITSRNIFNDLNGDWVLERAVRAASGTIVRSDAIITCGTAPGEEPPPGADPFAELCRSGASNWVSYQPASQFWPFQYIEAGIFLALAAVLLVFAIRKVRRIA